MNVYLSPSVIEEYVTSPSYPTRFAYPTFVTDTSGISVSGVDSFSVYSADPNFVITESHSSTSNRVTLSFSCTVPDVYVVEYEAWCRLFNGEEEYDRVRVTGTLHFQIYYGDCSATWTSGQQFIFNLPSAQATPVSFAFVGASMYPSGSSALYEILSVSGPTNTGTWEIYGNTIWYQDGDTNVPEIGQYQITVKLTVFNPGYKNYYTSNVLSVVVREQVDLPNTTTESFVYNGSQRMPTYSNFPGLYYTGGDLVATNVGSYQITYSLNNPGYQFWADNTTADKVKNWSITKANPEWSSEPDTIYRTYNSTSRTLISVGETFDGTVKYRFKKATVQTYSAWSSSVPSAKDAGYYDVQAQILGDSNHNDSSILQLSPRIGTASVTITAADKSMVYGGVFPTLTASVTSGTVYNDELGTISAMTTATASSNAGTYSIIPTYTENSNYYVVSVAGTLTISKQTGAWTLSVDHSTVISGKSALVRIIGSPVGAITWSVSSGAYVTLTSGTDASGPYAQISVSGDPAGATVSVICSEAASTNYNARSVSESLSLMSSLGTPTMRGDIPYSGSAIDANSATYINGFSSNWYAAYGNVETNVGSYTMCLCGNNGYRFWNDTVEGDDFCYLSWAIVTALNTIVMTAPVSRSWNSGDTTAANVAKLPDDTFYIETTSTYGDPVYALVEYTGAAPTLTAQPSLDRCQCVLNGPTVAKVEITVAGTSDYSAVKATLIITAEYTSGTRVYQGNEWKNVKTYIFSGGEWREALAYTYINGEWKKS